MSRGAALPMVLLALAMGSALAVGGSYVARRMISTQRVAERVAELEPLAERAIVDAVAAWDTVGRTAQAVGDVDTLPSTVATDTRVDIWVTRLSASTYSLVAQAERLGLPPMRRRLGALLYVAAGRPALVAQRAWSELP